MSVPDDIQTIRSEFIEKTGLMSQGQGLPRIAGRVFGMLLFDGSAISFTDIATDLQVSRASISTSMRLLEERGLVKRVAKPGERQDFFQLAPNPYSAMLGVQRMRNQNSLAEVRQTLSKLPQGADAKERLSEYAKLYASIIAALDIALTHFDAEPSKDTSDE